MTHFLLLLVCILSVEVFIRFNFSSILNSILKVTKKIIHVIPQNKISDHWKEKVIPKYASLIMNYSLKILFILLIIFSFFIVADFFNNDFHILVLSSIGIAESIFFAFGYFYFRSILGK